MHRHRPPPLPVTSQVVYHASHQHRLVQLPYNYGAVGFDCDLCLRPNPSKTRWCCSICNFDLCEGCKNMPIANSITHEHPLVQTAYNGGPSSYSNGFNCNSCLKSNPSPTRWWCSKCNYDLCAKCNVRLPERVRTHNHPLVQVARNGGSDSYYAHGFCCDLCNKPNPSPTRWWCSKCGYDICEACFAAAKNPAPVPIPNPTPVLNLNPTTANPPTEIPKDDSTTTCVVCMDAPRNAMILHNNTAHMCCCMGCAAIVQQKDGLCPICRQKIEMVVQVFVS